MDFQTWLDENPKAQWQEYGARGVQLFELSVSPVEYRKLWKLSDYYVSSLASGPSVILLPREIE